jgi:hypothetical protein
MKPTARRLAVALLATIGAALCAGPLVLPLAAALASLATSGDFRLDWLMPAELFPLGLAGGVLVVLAAGLARRLRAAAAAGAAAFVAGIGGVMLVSIIFGWAEDSWTAVAIIGLLGLHSLASAWLAACGLRLLSRRR